ncbi:MAG: hypothetical protein ACLP8S_19500 [Solirubrobacteraceae bacterium]
MTTGQTLSSSAGAWSRAAPISYSYQWQLCDPGCSNIGGATCNSYTLIAGDDGAKLEVVVTATNTAGSDQATASEVGPAVAAGPTAAQVKSALSKVLAPTGMAAKIAAVLKAGGYSFSFTAPGAGKLVIDSHTTVKGQQTLIASATAVFHHVGEAMVHITLTSKGRKLLRASKSLKLTANATFTSNGGASASATKSITLKRLTGDQSVRPPVVAVLWGRPAFLYSATLPKLRSPSRLGS